MSWTHPDATPTVRVPIDGENFRANQKYHVKITPRGEIEGVPSDPKAFETGEGIIAPEQPTFVNVDAPDNTLRVPAGTDYSITCAAEGYPPPKLQWLNEAGEVRARARHDCRLAKSSNAFRLWPTVRLYASRTFERRSASNVLRAMRAAAPRTISRSPSRAQATRVSIFFLAENFF